MISLQFFDSNKTLLRKRLFAQLIDFLLIYLIAAILSPIVISFPLLYYTATYLIYLTYSVILDAYTEGTPGKKVMGLKIVFDNPGSKLLPSLYRNTLKLFVFFNGYGTLMTLSRYGYSGYHNLIAHAQIVPQASSPKSKQA